MKNLAARLALTSVLLFSLVGLSYARTSVCPPAKGFSGSMLSWLMGRGQFAQAQGNDAAGRLTSLLVQGKTEEALALLQDLKADSTIGLGLFYLAAGKPIESLSAYTLDSIPDSACHFPELQLAAQYLSLYGNEAPLFPGFNGGFYHFLKDNLYGGEKLSVERFEKALGALYRWVQLTGGKSPVALELFADVLYRHPDRFIGNYFGSLTYMRAASLSPGNAKEALMLKSIFALEAPSEVAKRFDRYRFTQIQKAFFADLEAKSGEGTGATATEVSSGGILYMDGSNKGELPGIFNKAHARMQSGETKQVVVDQVDARKVKQDTTFNVYALFMISAVIGAVVFFWVKIKRAQSGK